MSHGWRNMHVLSCTKDPLPFKATLLGPSDLLNLQTVDGPRTSKNGTVGTNDAEAEASFHREATSEAN